MFMNCVQSLSNSNMTDPLKAAFATSSSFVESSPPPSLNSYKCRHCSKVFPTTQTLGGHQTAHRKGQRELRELNRLLRLQRQAEIDEMLYTADNDIVLSPEPISWAPPDYADQTPKVYNFFPTMENQVPPSWSEKKKKKKRKLSETKKVDSGAEDQMKNKKKLKAAKSMPSAEIASSFNWEIVQEASVGELSSSDGCVVNTASDELQKKKRKRKADVTELSIGCNSENKQVCDEKVNKKKKRRNTSKQSVCEEIKDSCSSDANHQMKKTPMIITKLKPSTELTLATGATPDVLVFTDSNGHEYGSTVVYF